MPSEPSTEKPTSELFPDQEAHDQAVEHKPERTFEPLAPVPKTLPNGFDGSSRGTLEGYAPLLPRCGMSNQVQHEQMPALEQRKGWYYFGVKFWYENQLGYSGSILKVICFACGAVWSGTWREVVATNTHGEKDPQRSYLLPRFAGGGILDLGDRKPVACTCTVGEFLWNGKGMPRASEEQVQEALERERVVTEEAAAMIERNGGNAKGLLSKMLLDLMRQRGAEERPAGGKVDPPPTPREPEQRTPPPEAEEEEYI